MDILVKKQDIMLSLSNYYKEKPMDDIALNELFGSLIDEFDENDDLWDWCLSFCDVHAIKFYNDEEFTKYLNYKYLIFDNADENIEE